MSDLKRIALKLLANWQASEMAAMLCECASRTPAELRDGRAALEERIADYKARIEAAEPEITCEPTAVFLPEPGIVLHFPALIKMMVPQGEDLLVFGADGRMWKVCPVTPEADNLAKWQGRMQPGEELT